MIVIEVATDSFVNTKLYVYLESANSIDCHNVISIRDLILKKIKVYNNKDFKWLTNLRFYCDPKQPDVLKQLSIHMANAKFQYGLEYRGVQ